MKLGFPNVMLRDETVGFAVTKLYFEKYSLLIAVQRGVNRCQGKTNLKP